MRSVWLDLDCCNGGIVKGVNNSDNDEDGDENYEDTEEDLCDGFFIFWEIEIFEFGEDEYCALFDYIVLRLVCYGCMSFVFGFFWWVVCSVFCFQFHFLELMDMQVFFGCMGLWILAGYVVELWFCFFECGEYSHRTKNVNVYKWLYDLFLTFNIII